MAFSFSIDASAVKPYDLNLYLGVLMDHRERNDKYKDVLEKLYLQASLLKSAVLDSSALSIYDAYMDKLNNATEALNSGLTMESANLANEARKQFSKDILPMEDARQRYLEELKFRRQEIAGGKPILYSSKNLPTFDAFYNNLPIKRGYNAEGLAARLGAVAKAVGESMQSDIGFLKVLDDLKIRIDETLGIPFEVIQDVITGKYDGLINLDTKNSLELLVNTYNQEKQAADYNNLDDVDKATFDSYAKVGLSLGAQASKTSFVDNKDLLRSVDALALQDAENTMEVKKETLLLIDELSKLDPTSDEYKLKRNQLDLIYNYGLSGRRRSKSGEDDDPSTQKYVKANSDGTVFSNMPDGSTLTSYDPNSADAVYLADGSRSYADIVSKLMDSYKSKLSIKEDEKDGDKKNNTNLDDAKETIRRAVLKSIENNKGGCHIGFTLNIDKMDGFKKLNPNNPLTVNYFIKKN